MKGIFTSDADRWITVHPNGAESTGSHVKIDENGTVKAGMGGKFNGVNIKHARAGEPRKDWAASNGYSEIKADPVGSLGEHHEDQRTEGFKGKVPPEQIERWKKQNIKDRENEKLKKEVEYLPALSGTEKQIKWAEDIRKNNATALIELRNIINKNKENDPQTASDALFIIDNVLKNTSSKWWIDNRDEKFSVFWLDKELTKKRKGLAMDSARKKDINGWLEVSANPISRVGVFFYSGRCISPGLDPNQLYPVFRPPEELNNQECIDSFKLLPWTDDHPQRLLGDGVPAEAHGIEGVIGEKVFFDPADGMLKANIKVFSQRHADLINSGKRELSAGYHCKYEHSPGEWNGKPYQFIQRHIRGNHLASVDSGRMGPEVAVMDGFRFTIDSSELKQMKKTNQIRKVMNRLLQFAQDAEENQELEEQEKGEIETLKSLVGQAAPLMDQLAALPTIMAKTQMEEEAAEDEDPDNDLLKQAAEDAYDEEPEKKKEEGGDEDEDDPDDDKTKKGGESGMDAKEIKRLVIETVKACMPKPQATAQAMDAKELMVQISRRDALAKQLTPFIGAFDADEMTLADVAKYGCEKLELKAPAGTELAMLSGFLHGRQAPQPLKAFGQDKQESTWLASQTKKGE